MKISNSELRGLRKVMESKNLSVSQVIELINSSNVSDGKVIDAFGEILLIIDYAKTIEQAIADGKYDGKNQNITDKNFPIAPELAGKRIEASARLFHFDRDISSDDAIAEMGKDGYRPATLMELLVLDVMYPELHRQFSIIALGSVWCLAEGIPLVPCLEVFGTKREFYLCQFVRDWRPLFYFLGVRQ